MNLLKCASVVAVVSLVVPTSRSEDKPDYAKLIVGKWEVIKSVPGIWPKGVIMEFTQDGKLEATIKVDGEADSFKGTYSLKGEKLKIKFGLTEDDGFSITKISQTEMSIKDDEGKEVTLKRVK